MDETQVPIPLTEFVMGIAREAARTVIKEHIESCPVAKDVIDLESDQKETTKEVGKLKVKFATLLGLMCGAGTAGGLAGGGLVSLLGG
jgi:hypothetical protein